MSTCEATLANREEAIHDGQHMRTKGSKWRDITQREKSGEAFTESQQ